MAWTAVRCTFLTPVQSEASMTPLPFHCLLSAPYTSWIDFSWSSWHQKSGFPGFASLKRHHCQCRRVSELMAWRHQYLCTISCSQNWTVMTKTGRDRTNIFISSRRMEDSFLPDHWHWYSRKALIDTERCSPCIATSQRFILLILTVVYTHLDCLNEQVQGLYIELGHIRFLSDPEWLQP